eukprot:402862-Prymnesium_polylepis.2
MGSSVVSAICPRILILRLICAWLAGHESFQSSTWRCAALTVASTHCSGSALSGSGSSSAVGLAEITTAHRSSVVGSCSSW